jgi:hypothetical protein
MCLRVCICVLCVPLSPPPLPPASVGPRLSTPPLRMGMRPFNVSGVPPPLPGPLEAMAARHPSLLSVPIAPNHSSSAWQHMPCATRVILQNRQLLLVPCV